jgi:lipid-binding SYLF domain-containing protein
MARHFAPSIAALSLFAVVAIISQAARAADPATTIADSEQVLAELIAIPGKQIPAKLVDEAQGIAIVPRVIKIGFVAGGRRGHGVVLVRDAEGAWSLPRFIRLTGGSVGWQAGVQGTDVVLVFRTRRSVENLLKGKFTIGVDAAASAGPVGRNAAAATDTSLQAEILSYSRSRGLFLGASIDGSAIELDQGANAAFYGSPDVEAPQIVPLAATQLQTYVTELAGGLQPAAVAAAPGAAIPSVANPAAVPGVAPAVVPAANVTEVRTAALRRSLGAQSAQLTPILSPEWRAYLALPPDVFDPVAAPNLVALADAYSHYETVAASPQYAALTARPEYQATMELLREYIAAVGAAGNTLQLPAPPPAGAARR